jgi:hypothetical protein
MTSNISLGHTRSDVFEDNILIRKPCAYAQQIKLYTSGGVSFTYPTDHFSDPPSLSITIELNTHVYDINDMIFGLVQSNTALGCTVLVTINNLDAATNSVKVHMRAYHVTY